MLLNLYRETSDNRVCNKPLTALLNITAIPTEKIDILKPSFIVEYNATILQANYCYISELGRHYYITKHTLEKGNRIIIECEVDVLKTYYIQLLQCTATIIRSESIGKPTPIPDKQLPIDPNREEILSIILDADPLAPSPYENSYHYVLQLIGGGNIGN